MNEPNLKIGDFVKYKQRKAIITGICYLSLYECSDDMIEIEMIKSKEDITCTYKNIQKWQPVTVPKDTITSLDKNSGAE